MRHIVTASFALAFVLSASLLAALRAGPASAAEFPLKPHHEVVAEVVAFLTSDVGVGGIRTLDDDPEGAPAPPYFYHYAIGHDDGLWSATVGYPGYASISYPGYTMAIAIDTFLAWWVYSGDAEGLARAVQCADWIVDRRTPSTDLYGGWPYSTQTDGVMGGGYDLDAVMSDKPGMMGVRFLRLYDITGDLRYLDAATEIADTYVATQRSGGPEEDGRWPFRVRPSDGFVRQDYTSHLWPAIDLLQRMEARAPGMGYGAAAQRAWAWIEANPMNPASPDHMRWEGFYEDIGPESAGLRDHYGAEATAAAYLERGAPGDLEKAIEIRDWSTSVFLAPDTFQNGFGVYDFSLLEWQAWMNTTYAATAQWGVLHLRLHQASEGTALHDPGWRDMGLRALHNLTWGQAPASSVPTDDGRMLTTVRELTQPSFGTETWYEQNFNTVLYLLEAFDLEPSLAPADAEHVLGYDGAEPTAVTIEEGRIETSWSGPGSVRMKFADEPDTLTGGVGQWDPATQVLTVEHQGGSVVAARVVPTSAPPGRQPRLSLDAAPNPFNPRTRITLRSTSSGAVSVEVVDLRGRKVRRLHVGPLPAGGSSWVWDGRDDRGRVLASGKYWIVARPVGVSDRSGGAEFDDLVSLPVTLVR